MFVAYYLIFKKFLHHIIEDLVFLIEVKEELYRPLLYCLLNSLVYFILMLCSVLDSEN